MENRTEPDFDITSGLDYIIPSIIEFGVRNMNLEFMPITQVIIYSFCSDASHCLSIHR